MNIREFKKKGSPLKGFQDENGNIIEDAFATDFGRDGKTYYVSQTSSGTTYYYMGYCDYENGKKLTEPFAQIIDGVFAYDRKGERYGEDNRFIKIYNPNTGECINPDFAEKIEPSIFEANKFTSPLSNTSLIDHRLNKDISSNLLLKFVKDNKIGISNQKGNIIKEPFANTMDVDGLFTTDNTIGIINLFTGEIEFELEYSDHDYISIYQPDPNKGQEEYVINIDNEYHDLTKIFPSIKDYLEIIKDVYQYKHY